MKLVREHINEKFTEDSDPIQDMGIGSRYLIEKWLKKYGIKNYKINEDLTINIKGNLYLDDILPGNFPDYIQFKYVSENVAISNNHLTTLKGCPQVIGGWFSCHMNELTSLEYGPKKIQTKINFSNNYECNDNKLTSLKGLPKVIKGRLFCYNNAKKFTREDIKNAKCIVNGEIRT
jgi:hypothetical protein